MGSRGGLYPTAAVDALRTLYAEALALQSKVEDDYISMTVRLRTALTAASTPNPITRIQQKLADLMAEGDSIINTVNPAWAGTAPLMHNREAYDALVALLAEIERVEPYYNDDDALPYVDSLAVLTEAAATLNLPDPADGYYIVNASGHYLDATDGLVLADTLTTTEPSVWNIIHVNHTADAFYLSTGDRYLFMKAGGNGMPSFNDTRRALYGKFYVTPNGPGTFTITSLYGLLGADVPAADGTPVTGAATDLTTTTWTLRRAPDDTAVRTIAAEDGQMDATQPFDYAVKLNPDTRTIRFETMDDPAPLASITARLYTTGGRLLYTFAASQPQSLVDLPSGTYILTWNGPDGRTHTIRFQLAKP